MLLFPQLSWKLSLGLEYMALIVLALSVLLYIHSMFKGALHRTVLWAFGAVCAVYAAHGGDDAADGLHAVPAVV